MIQGLYSAASSLTAAGERQDAISDNLANATVPGYRGRGVSFRTFDPPDGSAPVGKLRGTQVSRQYSLFTPGDYQKTDNPLELAVRGDGFFVLQGPTGPLYTRNGSFELGPTGQLQSKAGLPVLGDGGPVTIPAGSVGVSVALDGRVTAGGQQLGQLQVVSFANPDQLVRVGSSLFAVGDAAPGAASGEVLQGYREASNVSVVKEMVNLIIGSRHYEAASKALTAISDTLKQQTQQQG
jgi:flagellar basal-body rod protein FlgF